MADDSIGLWNPVVKGYTGRRWSVALVQDSLPVDTTGWDVIAMARSDLDDATAALELSVSNSRVTVGGGTDDNVIVFTVDDSVTKALQIAEDHPVSKTYQWDVLALPVGASAYQPLFTGVFTLEGSAARTAV
ncbi:hypothetical protein [EBPR siphovirus 6]|nr:hypothetical protein [EBPR siphovirus 6]